MTDAELVARFGARHQVDAELAFEALMQRHGSMVFRVCWDVLHDEHAAEDAFQATFLVLARKVRSLGVKDSLGSWLYSVAHRVATRALCDSAKRRRHEPRFAETRSPDYEVMPELHDSTQRQSFPRRSTSSQSGIARPSSSATCRRCLIRPRRPTSD